MIYREHRPAPPLDSYVRTLWYCEGYQAAHAKERILPNGTFQLVIELSRGYIRQWGRAPGAQDFYDDSAALLVGMQSQYGVIDTAGLKSVAGVVFEPGCARAFFDVPADEFYNRDTPLDQVWGAAAASSLRSRLQEALSPAEKLRIFAQTLERRLIERYRLHAGVRYALRNFQNTPECENVLAVARNVGLSRRRFAQLFREQVGLTPKLYCRIVRFQKVLRQIRRGEEVDWADVALAGGYCDQAHLAHEFREFSGISPGVYVAGQHRWTNHVPLD